MSLIERFCKDCVRRSEHERKEDIEVRSFDPKILIATRSFLTLDRLVGRRRRGSVLLPDIIGANGVFYAIDGHHKIWRDIAANINEVECRFKNCESVLMAQRLAKRDCGPIWKLPVLGR